MEISSRVLLRTGLQIVGVITIITGIRQTIVNWSNLPYSEGMTTTAILVVSILIPLFTLTAGIYLYILCSVGFYSKAASCLYAWHFIMPEMNRLL